jgi:hypothetical protein
MDYTRGNKKEARSATLYRHRPIRRRYASVDAAILNLSGWYDEAYGRKVWQQLTQPGK